MSRESSKIVLGVIIVDVVHWLKTFKMSDDEG